MSGNNLSDQGSSCQSSQGNIVEEEEESEYPGIDVIMAHYNHFKSQNLYICHMCYDEMDKLSSLRKHLLSSHFRDEFVSKVMSDITDICPYCGKDVR